eukprot:30626-Pelagococcus_subviridis.AAC.13
MAFAMHNAAIPAARPAPALAASSRRGGVTRGVAPLRAKVALGANTRCVLPPVPPTTTTPRARASRARCETRSRDLSRASRSRITSSTPRARTRASRASRRRPPRRKRRARRDPRTALSSARQ